MVHLIGACRKVREQAEKRADWLGLLAGLPSYGRCEIRLRPTYLTAISKLCDRPLMPRRGRGETRLVDDLACVPVALFEARGEALEVLVSQ